MTTGKPTDADLSMLASFYRRWEPQEDTRREISDDLKELFAEAKGNGFNAKALRKAFAARYRLDHEGSEQREARELTDEETELYRSALARVRESDADDEHDDESESRKHIVVNEPALTNTTADGEDGAGASVLATNRSPSAMAVTTLREGVQPSLAGAEGDADRQPTNVVTLKSYANDPPHPDCLKPSLCKGYSNIKLCQPCIDAAAGFVAVEAGGVQIPHRGDVA